MVYVDDFVQYAKDARVHSTDIRPYKGTGFLILSQLLHGCQVYNSIRLPIHSSSFINKFKYMPRTAIWPHRIKPVSVRSKADFKSQYLVCNVRLGCYSVTADRPDIATGSVCINGPNCNVLHGQIGRK